MNEGFRRTEELLLSTATEISFWTALTMGVHWLCCSVWAMCSTRTQCLVCVCGGGGGGELKKECVKATFSVEKSHHVLYFKNLTQILFGKAQKYYIDRFSEL